MVVAVAVAVAAAVDDHRVVQDRAAVNVLGLLELLEEPGELLHVPEVDLGDLLELLLLALVMREVVVALGDPDVGERPVARLVGQQEGGDPRRVGPEGQEEQVVHELDVLEEAGRDAGRGLAGGVGGLAEPLGRLDAALDLADAGQVLVQLLLVARAELVAQGAGVLEHEVEDRPLLLQPLPQALAALAGRARRRRAARRRSGDWPRASSAAWARPTRG